MPAAARARLAAGAEPVAVAAGSWLFRQGEAGDALYVVRAGRLEAVVERPGPARIVRELGRADVVGELALLTGDPRSASIRAVRDAALVRIPRGAVLAALRAEPGLASAMLALLGRQLAASGALAPPARRAAAFAVVAAAPDAPVAAVAGALRDAFAGWGPVTALEAGDAADAATALDAAEAAGNRVLLVAGGDPAGPWPAFCVRQADRALVLATAGRPPGGLPPALRGRDLGLCFPPHATDAAPWLDALAPRARHVLRPGPSLAADAARAARRLAGRSVGVVLSGGGARGLAHLGVLAALAEAGVVVDRIGGTSMGAFVAGLAACGLDGADVCRREFVEASPFRGYGVPRAALLRPGPVEAMLTRVFGARAFEECAIDAFAVSADLVAAEVVAHRTGAIRAAVRASMSVPGWLPPVPDGRRLLVDGGVLDNLPVDVMAATGEGPIVAVDVMGRTLADPARVPARLPSAVDTVARATVLGSWRAAAENRAAADLVIAPGLGDAGIRDWARMDALVAAGRRAACDALATAPDTLAP